MSTPNGIVYQGNEKPNMEILSQNTSTALVLAKKIIKSLHM